MTKGEWASWFQALFAAVGVVTALFVVWYQLKQNRRAEFVLAAQRLEAHAALIEYGAAGVHVVKLQTHGPGLQPNLEAIRRGYQQLEQVKEALDRFQLETGRSSEEISSLLSARDTADALLKLKPQAISGRQQTSLDLAWLELKQCAATLSKEAKHLRQS